VSISGTPAAAPLDPSPLPANFVRLARLTIQIPPDDTIIGADIVDLRGSGWGTDEAPIAPALSGAWVVTPGFVTGYRKVGRRVSVQGVVRTGSGTIFTMPVGYRPSQQVYFATTGNGAFALIGVSAAGVVSLVTGSSIDVSLDVVSYFVAPAPA